MDKSNLTVIIVNWNTCNMLRECIKSIISIKSGDGRSEIIVVDNGSLDGSPEMVEKIFPQVNLLRNKENLGFAKANNQALELVETPYVCLLNSDTVVNPGVLDSLVLFLDHHSEAVACGPALRLPSGCLQTGGAGYELSLRTAFNYFFFLSRIFPDYFPGMYIYQDYFVHRGRPVKVDWLAGACLMVRMSAIKKVGKLDDRFHMYAEDAEWCHRLGKIGDLWYLPYVEILHLFGASSDKKEKVPVRWLDSTFDLFEHDNGFLKLKIFQLICIGGFSLRAFLYACCNLFQEKRTEKARILSAYALHSCRRLFLR